MKLLISIVSVFLMVTPMLAQEIITDYKFFGFSDDLKYCAFEMFEDSRTEDGAAYSYIYIIDVDKNDFTVRPLYSQDTSRTEESLNLARKANQKKAASLFRQYKITGNKLGTLLYSFDTRAYLNAYDTLLEDDGAHIGLKLKIKNEDYTIRLSTVGTGSADYMGRPELMAVVDLVHKGNVKVLQQATKAPKSWGMIIGYQIIAVYQLENKLAIFLEYQGPGFEGYPDRQQMIVTGSLN